MFILSKKKSFLKFFALEFHLPCPSVLNNTSEQAFFTKQGGILKSIQPINKANIQIFKSSFQTGSPNLFTPSFGAVSSPHMGLSLTAGSAQVPAHHLQSASPPPPMENNSQSNTAPPNCSTPTSALQPSSIQPQQR